MALICEDHIEVSMLLLKTIHAKGDDWRKTIFSIVKDSEISLCVASIIHLSKRRDDLQRKG